MEKVARYLSFAFAAADLLIEVDGTGTITFALGAARTLLGHPQDDLVGTPFPSLFDARDRGMVEALLAGMTPGSRCRPVLVRLASPDGACRHVLLSACRLAEMDGPVSFTLTHAAAGVDHPSEARPCDSDTQLLTAPAFGAVAADLVHSARRLGQDVRLSFIDAPGIAALAERSPDAGRALVQRVGDILRTVSVDGCAAGRIAATRFGVVHHPDVANLPERIRAAAPGVDLGLHERDMMLDAIGLTREDMFKAIRFAVNALATAPDLTAVPASLEEAIDRIVSDTVQRMADFSAVVQREDFRLLYQPIVDLSSGAMHHFEVLSRFEEGRSPFEMIRFAEDIGIIERFDLAVFTRTAGFLNTLAPAAPRLAVNVSARSIDNPIFMRVLFHQLDVNAALRDRLLFEITESCKLRDLAQADQTIQEFRTRGFAVCLDDFGAGAASFEYLQALSVDFVKIDGAYIRRMGESARDDAMLRGMVRLCEDLGVATIAEMVESDEQAAALRGMGVRFGQGWLFGRPAAEPAWTPRAAGAAAVRGSPRLRRVPAA